MSNSTYTLCIILAGACVRFWIAVRKQALCNDDFWGKAGNVFWNVMEKHVVAYGGASFSFGSQKHAES